MLTRDEIADANSKMLGNARKAHARTIGLTMYPAYPAGYFKGVGMYPYGYQNGGDWTWFGARMIWALAENGFIREAYDELRPMLARVIENGGFNEWYTPAGEPMGSGTFRGEAGVLVTAIDMLREWAVQHDRVTMPEGPGVKVVRCVTRLPDMWSIIIRGSAILPPIRSSGPQGMTGVRGPDLQT